MKKVIIVSALAGLMLIASGCSQQPIVIDKDAFNKTNTITVSGQGESETKPDTAYLSVRVSVEKKESKEAQSISNQTVSDVYTSLKAVGIEKDAIETEGFSIDMIRDYNNQTKYITNGEPAPYPIIGYRVNNSMKIKISEIDNVSKVIDAVSGKENVTVNNLIFGLADEKAAKNEAIQDATKNAKMQAEAAAEAVGAKIKGVKSVTVGNVQNGLYYASSKTSVDSGLSSGSTVTPGDVKTKASVQVEFHIEG